MPSRIAAVVSGAVLLVMAGAIVYGFAAGDFGDEGSAILDLAWGRVTLIDLYAGLVLFGAWIVFRERSWTRTAAWWASLIVLGNLAAAGYVLVAAVGSRGDVAFLLTGRHGAEDRPGSHGRAHAPS